MSKTLPSCFALSRVMHHLCVKIIEIRRKAFIESALFRPSATLSSITFKTEVNNADRKAKRERPFEDE